MSCSMTSLVMLCCDVDGVEVVDVGIIVVEGSGVGGTVVICCGIGVGVGGGSSDMMFGFGLVFVTICVGAVSSSGIKCGSNGWMIGVV